LTAQIAARLRATCDASILHDAMRLQGARYVPGVCGPDVDAAPILNTLRRSKTEHS